MFRQNVNRIPLHSNMSQFKLRIDIVRYDIVDLYIPICLNLNQHVH